VGHVELLDDDGLGIGAARYAKSLDATGKLMQAIRVRRRGDSVRTTPSCTAGGTGSYISHRNSLS
jgi:hypothetical protein